VFKYGNKAAGAWQTKEGTQPLLKLVRGVFALAWCAAET